MVLFKKPFGLNFCSGTGPNPFKLCVVTDHERIATQKVVQNVLHFLAIVNITQ